MNPPCHISGLELSRYRDGETPPAELAGLARHIDGCETCQHRLADATALNVLLIEQLRQSEQTLPADFAGGVMRRLSAPNRVEAANRAGWLAALVDLVAARRPALTFGLAGLALTAVLAIVFAPQLRSSDDRLEEATENEAQIHSIEVTSPDRSAVVFESSQGNTVIWMVPSGEEDAGSASAAKP